MPDNNDPRPAKVQIADDLRAKIDDGRMPLGKMPSQRAMAEFYGVAPGTLQDALDILAAEGLVSRGNTRGTFVLRTPAEAKEPSPEYLKLEEMFRQLAGRVDALERLLKDQAGDGHHAGPG